MKAYAARYLPTLQTHLRLAKHAGVMADSPLAALDLPLKVLVWADGGQTNVTYYSPGELAARHHLSADLAASLAGIDPLRRGRRPLANGLRKKAFISVTSDS